MMLRHRLKKMCFVGGIPRRIRMSATVKPLGGRSDIFLAREYVDGDAESALRRALGEDDDDDADETKLGVRYVALNGRKCRPYGGTVHEKGTVRVDDFPPVVRRLMERAAASVREIDDGVSSSGSSSAAFQPNHALVNVYDFDRGDGIMSHEDGPLYRDCVCIVSIGASCVLTFRPKEMKSASGADDEAPNAKFHKETTNPRERLPFDVFVPSRSLLVFTKAVYTEYLHGIETRESDARSNPLLLNPEDFPDDDAPRRGRRISITMREVLNLRRGLEFLTKRLAK